MPKPKRSYPIRSICRDADVPPELAMALFAAIVNTATRGRAVYVPGFGKFWIQEYSERTIRIPVKRGAKRVRSLKVPGGFALRFSSTGKLRDALRERRKGVARGT